LYEYSLKSVSFLTLFVETNVRLRRFKIVDISKKDWKLFRERLSGWQENYMEACGVSYSSIKRFEETGNISLLSLTKMAIALDAEGDIKKLFSEVPYRSIQEVINEQK